MAMTLEESERLNQLFEAALRQSSGNYTPSDCSSIGSITSDESIDQYIPSSMSVQSKVTQSGAQLSDILKSLNSFQESDRSASYLTQSQASGTQKTTSNQSQTSTGTQKATSTQSQTSTDGVTTTPLPIYITTTDEFNIEKEKSSEEETGWQFGYIAFNRDAVSVELSGPCAGQKTFSGFFIPISPKIPDQILKMVENLKKTNIKNILNIDETCAEINKKIVHDMFMKNQLKPQYVDDDAVLQSFKEQFAEKIKLEVSKRKLKKREIKQVNEAITDKLGEEFIITLADIKSRLWKFLGRLFPCICSTVSD